MPTIIDNIRRTTARVVPLVGTWIEINQHVWNNKDGEVVPLVGTWIEIISFLALLNSSFVVPLVGTWIEIPFIELVKTDLDVSFPLWERGLKSLNVCLWW